MEERRGGGKEGVEIRKRRDWVCVCVLVCLLVCVAAEENRWSNCVDKRSIKLTWPLCSPSLQPPSLRFPLFSVWVCQRSQCPLLPHLHPPPASPSFSPPPHFSPPHLLSLPRPSPQPCLSSLPPPPPTPPLLDFRVILVHATDTLTQTIGVPFPPPPPL